MTPLASGFLAWALARLGERSTWAGLAAAVLPLLGEAVAIGLDQALIAARNDSDAANAVDARKRALLDPAE